MEIGFAFRIRFGGSGEAHMRNKREAIDYLNAYIGKEPGGPFHHGSLINAHQI